jgi:hypothetical protein
MMHIRKLKLDVRRRRTTNVAYRLALGGGRGVLPGCSPPQSKFKIMYFVNTLISNVLHGVSFNQNATEVAGE